MAVNVATGKPFIFISYASADRERVLPIVAALRDAGITCWIDQHGIEGGANWGRRIAEAIEGCAAFVLMSSTASLSSRNVRQEIALAWKYNRHYLPLMLDTTPVPKEIEYWLEAAQWIEVLDHSTPVWLPKVQHAVEQFVSHQVATPELSSSTPPSSSLVETELPTPLSSFVGREQEVMEVAGLLRTERIVTLVGPGGIGKTRIAIAVGHRMRAAYPDGVVFVDLTPLRDPSLVVPTIASTLAIRDVQGQSVHDRVIETLRARHLLLILDNAEQVIDAAAEIGKIVTQCPMLAIQVTSREPLRISGETEYVIHPLPLPPPGHSIAVAALRENPTVALFLQRAQSVRSGFDLSADNAETITTICERLDGLPLAIELAAARSRILSPQGLLDRLQQPLTFLTSDARDLPARQQTIRATIQWSYDLLTPDEQRLFQRLSVFVGGWTLEAAEAVVVREGDLGIDVLDGLVSLVEKSLVVQADQPGGEVRFSMLVMIHEFAKGQRASTDDDNISRARHAQYFLRLAESTSAQLDTMNLRAAVATFERDHDNLRAVLDWAMAQHDQELALRLAGVLGPFWQRRGYGREGRARLEAALAMPGSTAIEFMRDAMYWVTSLAHHGGDITRASDVADQMLTLGHEHGDTVLTAYGLHGTGILAAERGESALALERLRDALTLYRQLNNQSEVVNLLDWLGFWSLVTGSLDDAQVYYDEARYIAETFGFPNGEARALSGLADIARRQGDDALALSLCNRSLDLYWTHLDDLKVAYQLVQAAAIVGGQSDLRLAVRLLAAAQTILDAVGLRLLNFVDVLRMETTRAARAALGDEFEVIWSAQRDQPLEQIVAEVMARTSSSVALHEPVDVALRPSHSRN